MGTKKQVIGYRYYIGMHMIAGHGHMDGCERIRVGEKTAWSHSNVLKDNHAVVKTALPVNSNAWVAQTFTATSNYTLDSVALMMYRDSGNLPGIITVSIRAVDINGHPTGDDLCVATSNGNTLPTIYDLNLAEWREFEFVAPIILVNTTKYAICVRTTESSTADTAKWICNNLSGYANGNVEVNTDGGVTWSAHTSTIYDLLFKCYKKDGSAPNSRIYINQENLFGGVRSDGGVVGSVDFEFGDSDQLQNTYLVAKLDSDIPAYRGLWGTVLNQVYIGMSSYLKPWMFLCKRVCRQLNGDPQWYKEKAVINPREEDGDDLNAAHIIRECLIAPEWGLGWSEDDIDDDAFKEAANILYDEGFGLSMLWDQVEPMEDFVDEVLNYIAGILYQDLSTGKWVLSLTRDNDFSTAYDGYITGDNSQATVNITQHRQFAQSFTTSRTYKPASCKIKIFKAFAGETVNAKCEIQSVDANGKPDGNIIAQGTIPTEDIGLSADWVTYTFTKTGTLNLNTQYALVVYPNVGIGTLSWRVNVHGSFEGGVYLVTNDDAATWSKVLGSDFMFEIFAGGELESFNEDQILAIEDFSRSSYGEITTTVTVKFWDKLNHKSRSTEDRDIALIEKQGGNEIEKILNYQGICNIDLANRVAARELKLASQMLAGIRLKCNRQMAHLKPNSVFLFSSNKLEITQMALRVLNANYGSLHNNSVVLTCAEDEFGAAATIYGAAPDTQMVEPISDAVDVINRIAVEIPYWSLVNDIFESKDLVDALNPDFTRMAIVAGKPVRDAFDFDLWTRFNASYEYVDVGQGNNLFCPFGTLTDGLAQSGVDVNITLATDTDLDDVTVGSYAIIGDEYVLVNSVDITTKIVNISRAVLDTVPTLHSAGDVIYFAGLHYVDVAEEYTVGNSPDSKLLTRTGKGSLAIGDATILDATAFDRRQIRPYPPGNLKFNGESFPSHVSSGANGNKISLTWNHRDRTNVTQLNSMILHTAAVNYGPEAGVTYTIKVYGGALLTTLKRTVTGLSTTSYDYTESFEIADFGALQETLRFVIYSVRDGYNSWKDGHNVIIKRSMRGTIVASSNLNGDLSGWLEGAVSAISVAAGELDVIPLYRGRADAVSGANGELNIQPQLLGTINAISDVTGYMEHIPDPALLVDFYTSGMSSSEASSWAGPNDNWVAQTFTASEDYIIEDIVLKLYRNDIIPGNVNVSIQDVDGVGKPTGIDLCLYTINQGYIITQNSEGSETAFHLHYCEDYPVTLENGTKYAIVLKSPTNENAEIHWINDHAAATYAGGFQMISNDAGASWTISVPKDLYFKTYK